MMKYSVVVPVYNTEKYLGACLDSILAQDSPSAYEVILVDDGSADRSGVICDEYADQYDCISVIHQKNQGVSAARNAGIAAAKGEYVPFLDGDDLWVPELLAHMDVCASGTPDVVEFGFEEFCGDQTGAVEHMVIDADHVGERITGIVAEIDVFAVHGEHSFCF